MSEENVIDLQDIMNMDFDNLTDIEVQKAMVEEIERLRAEGKSDAESIRLVFEHNKELH
ncbi:hypothetical protein [Parendozoicomonas sp. Alg238-R29]|uniref:hypothetical protein n=1 Tax=Parendozoicomonas sp. Alg238-R29 TaxID=2993446 RepID=UPI00248ED632|nr:hypothetical protein [Parendozoicomonas sp. Alg238-R29]